MFSKEEPSAAPTIVISSMKKVGFLKFEIHFVS